jgi:type II secretory pathway pseudopilin PulG
VRAERVGRSEKLERAERLNRADEAERPSRLERAVRAEAAASRAAMRSRRAEMLGRRGGLDGAGLDAPVDGTAALQVEAEPLRIEEPERAARVIDLDRPRLRVAPPAPISVPRAPFVAGVLGVVVAGVLGILLVNTKTNENSFKIADLQKQSSALDAQQQDLDNQLATVSSPGSLDAAARRLGLVKAQPAVIRLPDGRVIGMLKPADGKTSVTAQDAATDGDKGAANIVPDNAASTQPGLAPNGIGSTAPVSGGVGTGTGTTGTGTTGTGTTGTGSTGTGSTGTGTTGTGTTGTGTNGTGTNGTAANGATGSGAATGGVPAAGTGR